MTSAGITSTSGKTYLTRLRAICDASGVVPTPLVLPGTLDDLGTQPVDSNGLANIHKATYQGRVVAVKALKPRRIQTSDDTHKVRVQFVCIVTDTHSLGPPAVGQGGDRVGMAPT